MMNEDVFFSIVVPVYNVKDYIEKFIESIQKQEYKNFEVIFVNDGSTDGSENIIAKMIENIPNYMLINKINEGSGKARNTGLSKAKGKYIYFADPDDSVSPKLLSDSFSILCKQEINVLLFGFEIVDANSNRINVVRNETDEYILENKEFFENYVKIQSKNSLNAVWNKIYRTEFLRENNLAFPQNRTAQDAIFNYCMFRYINKLYISSNIYYYYLVDREDSAQNTKKIKYNDELDLLETQIVTFTNFASEKEKEFMINKSIVDFFTNQIITYKGNLPDNLLNLNKFKLLIGDLNEIKFEKSNGYKFNIRLFLLKHKLYKILYLIIKLFL